MFEKKIKFTFFFQPMAMRNILSQYIVNVIDPPVKHARLRILLLITAICNIQCAKYVGPTFGINANNLIDKDAE